MRLLARMNRPWVHFLLLGFLLFRLQAYLFPEPRPVVGPLSEERVALLEQQWFAATGRLPSEPQRQRLIQSELDREVLFQRALELEIHLHDTVVYQRLLRNMRFLQLGGESSDDELYRQALDMGLHLGDEVVKRRMVQVMEQLLLAANPPALATEAELAAEFERRREELRHPPRYTIEHVYFNREREPEVAALAADIRTRNLDPAAARELSSPFLPGYVFNLQSPDQLARHFGIDFVTNLQGSAPAAGEWCGPVRSTYGLHLVYVHHIEPAREATLEESRRQLQRDLESRARQTALQESVAALRETYEVRI
jgi:hypothetical protein